MPIFKTSEHDLVPRLEWAFAHDELSRHIVFNANRFALTYTTYKARVRGLAAVAVSFGISAVCDYAVVHTCICIGSTAVCACMCMLA